LITGAAAFRPIVNHAVRTLVASHKGTNSNENVVASVEFVIRAELHDSVILSCIFVQAAAT
jgi:hypothetical protein